MKSRPLTYHLKYYYAQLTSTFSVLHRISGCLLGLCALFNGLYIYLVPFCIVFSKAYYIQLNLVAYGMTSSFTVILFVCFTLLFHSLNGFRHLYSDCFCSLHFPFMDNSSLIMGILIILASLFIYIG